MHAAAATTGRRAAQMLKEPRVLLPARPATGVIDRNKCVQRVIGHLAHAKNTRMLRAQIHDQLARAFMHVAVNVIDVAADDIEKVGIDTETLNDVRDTRLEM